MSIPLVYLSSSAINTYRMCPMKFFMEYTLGWRGPAGKAADKGTIVHKVLEILALLRDKIIVDDDLGEIAPGITIKELTDLSYDYYAGDDWTPQDRRDCHNWVNKVLDYNDGMFDPRNLNIVDAELRFHLPFENDLSIKGVIDLIVNHGDLYEIIDWKGLPLDTPLRTPSGFTTMRNVEIGEYVLDMQHKPSMVVGKSQVKIKPCFELTLDNGNTVICDNEHLWRLHGGNVVGVTELSIGDKIQDSGTIIEIKRVQPRPTQCIMVDSPTETYLCTKNDIVTHNTGRRVDWATGKEKTQANLKDDHQLRLYHYAATQLFPDVEAFMVTIFFVKDGGPFTLSFTKEDVPSTIDMINRHAKSIRNTKIPSRIKEHKPSQKWKCSKFCFAGQTSFDEPRLNEYGEPLCKCDEVYYEICDRGLLSAMEKYKK